MTSADRGGSTDGPAPRPHAGAVLASGLIAGYGRDQDPDEDAVLRDFVAFTRLLRSAGVPVTADRTATYLRALREVDLASEVATYWAGRLTLCSDPDDVARYDHAFHAWFSSDPREQRMGRPAPPTPRTATIAALSDAQREGPDDGGDDDVPELRVAASGEEVLRDRDIAELTIGEREHLRRMLELLRPDPPRRRARRRRPARRGEADSRRTLRAALRHGGEIQGLARRERHQRPRRVVLLLDVSGSMAPYADALLRFAHVLTRRTPQAVETFTLGTRLTRVTRELRQRDPERALRDAGSAIPDWSGGTRLGEVLGAFLDRWGQRGVARRAVVVVFSDGWERGGTELLGAQMARLARLAHSVIWVNPHAGKEGYEPVQGGIAAALPHVDELLAGHSLATLQELTEVLSHA
jgi:uncharacterized protein